MYLSSRCRTVMLGLCLSLLLPLAAEAQTMRAFDPGTQGSGGAVRHRAPAMSYRPSRAQPDPAYDARIVSFATKLSPGSILVDTGEKFLYLVMAGGKAKRYGIGVGREGFGWSGDVKVGRKATWPTWTPPSAMIERQPELVRYASGMPGGPENPLGARALYLYDGGRDTMFRIHGTNEPGSIGRNVSSGCIRMLNENVVDLYSRVKVGARVVVR